MLIREHVWNEKSGKNLRRMFEGHGNVITCDPDANGALVRWSGARFAEARSLADPYALRWLTETVKVNMAGGRTLLVIETQFSRINLNSTIDMAFKAGCIVGAAAVSASLGVEAVHVYASSWQTWTQRQAEEWRNAEKLKKLKSPEMRALIEQVHSDFCARTVPGYRDLGEKQADGMRCAVGIGHWWLKEVARCWA